jgi:hypothetical protein
MLECPDQLEFHGGVDMPIPEIEEFAKILVQRVRDSAIQSCDRQLQPGARSPVAKRWREAASDGEPGIIANVIVPDCVDETVFYLLQAIDQGLLQLSFSASNGKTVDLAAEGLGELSGWYMASGGWRAMYTTERFVDDFADL